MGFMKSIYFANDLEVIQDEENASGLICSLLREHYKNKAKSQKDLSITEIRQKKEEWLAKNSIHRGAMQVFEDMEKDAEVREQMETEQKASKLKSRLEVYKDNAKMFLDVPESELEGLAEMYEAERLTAGSFVEWAEAKGLKLKDLEEPCQTETTAEEAEKNIK